MENGSSSTPSSSEAGTIGGARASEEEGGQPGVQGAHAAGREAEALISRDVWRFATLRLCDRTIVL